MINIEDLECVVYYENGVLKNVSEQCEYVITNSNESTVD